MKCAAAPQSGGEPNIRGAITKQETGVCSLVLAIRVSPVFPADGVTLQRGSAHVFLLAFSHRAALNLTSRHRNPTRSRTRTAVRRRCASQELMVNLKESFGQIRLPQLVKGLQRQLR